MKSLKKTTVAVALAFVVSAGLAACSPEVGSKEWCEDMKKKDKGTWSGNEAADFAKSCLL